MSAPTAHSMPEPEFLGELLHTLSQPLTSLRCSLELSIEEPAEQRQQNVAAALEQTERVIGVVKLMQEYLDCESANHTEAQTLLADAVHRVLDKISVLAEARQIRVYVRGTCRALIRMPEERLLAALQYLIGSVLEMHPMGSAVRFALQDVGTESVLTVQALPETSVEAAGVRDPVGATLQRVRIAIARRMLEAAGASLQFENKDGVISRLRAPIV